MTAGDTFRAFKIAALTNGVGGPQIPITGGSLIVLGGEGDTVCAWAGITFLTEDGDATLAERTPAETARWRPGAHSYALRLTTAGGTFTYLKGRFPILRA